MDEFSSFTAILVAFSVPLVAFIRKCHWPDIVTFLLATVTLLVLYTFGQFLDNELVWPLTSEYRNGLLMAFGGQQFLFQLVKDTHPMNTLEAFNSNPQPRSAALFDVAREYDALKAGSARVEVPAQAADASHAASTQERQV